LVHGNRDIIDEFTVIIF